MAAANCEGQVAVVDDGVEVKQSAFGLGLFSTRTFQRLDLITEYAGPLITSTEAKQCRERGDGSDSHFRGLSGMHTVIAGLRRPVAGLGGASFANHRDGGSEWNADFRFVPVVREPLLSRCYQRRGRHDLGRIFLRARRVIPAGEEICAHYGRGYWALRLEAKVITPLLH
jgi:hypothetical protein